MSRTPKRRALGNALREARKEQDLTLRAFAKQLDCNWGNLSRWETGDHPVKPDEVGRILTMLGVSGSRYKEITKLAYEVDRESWVATTSPDYHHQLAALVDIERQATKIIDIDPVLIPGLLQTDDYIRAVMAGLPEEDAKVRIATRLERREALTQPLPVRYTALVGEGALYQMLGGRDVMIAQLRHLMNLAERPNIDLRVIRYGTGWHPALAGSFHLVESREASAVFVENCQSVLVLHRADEVDAYRQAARQALPAAMPPGDTLRFIAKVVTRMESLT